MSAYQTYYKCDRCGKTTFDNPYLFKDYVEGDYVLSIVSRAFDDGDNDYSDKSIPHIYVSNYHLCEECQNELNKKMGDFMGAFNYGNPVEYIDGEE